MPNIKLKILIIVLSVFLFIFIKNIHLNKYSKNLFIDFASLLSLIENNKTAIIYDYLTHRDKVYCLYNGNNLKENKDYINNIFPSVKFMNKFQFILYSKIFKEKIMCYINNEDLIEYAKKNNIKYCRVVLDINKINYKEYLTLRDKDNARIFLSITNKDYYNSNKYAAKLDKKYITVLDGDTIKYRNKRYRFIGLDAPELNQNYGENSKRYVINSISNADKIYMLVSSYDLFDRILCHIVIDEEPLAYSMIKDKQAKETIIKYGDGGFPIIASNIVYLSKFQGRRPFIDPAVFRRTNR